MECVWRTVMAFAAALALSGLSQAAETVSGPTNRNAVVGNGPAAPVTRAMITVAAASDLTFCLEDLIRDFTNRSPGAVVRAVTGSSGNFFAQIQRGAPFDVFLSADLAYARALTTNGLADPATLRPYAVGRLVLWTMRTNLPVDQGLAVLTNATVRRFAIANPEHAPYGRAAREALTRSGLWTMSRDKLVLGDNISQAAQFVQSGHADAGLVALSLVSAPRLRGAGRWWLVPEEAHGQLLQGMVITRHGQTNALAHQFVRHLESPAARLLFESHGFARPPADWKPPADPENSRGAPLRQPGEGR